MASSGHESPNRFTTSYSSVPQHNPEVHSDDDDDDNNNSNNNNMPPTNQSTLDNPRRLRRSSTATSVVSNASSRIRAASVKLMDADPPVGMWAATGSHISKAPTLADIRRGSFDRGGWKDPTQGPIRGVSQGSIGRDGRRPSGTRLSSGAASSPGGIEAFAAVTEEDTTTAAGYASAPPATARDIHGSEQAEKQLTASETTRTTGTGEERPLWEAPPPLPWTTTTLIGLRAFWHWFLTIPGFLITLYGLNVVAWGGMLFLLLCNAAPAMCHPTCNDIDSPRRVWIEIDSQILNGLFCVTGFGLAPWRFRDLYWWVWWRLGRTEETKSKGLRRLAGINNGWFRLPGSDKLAVNEPILDPNSPAVPIPVSKTPTPPLTGIRAPPTRMWTLDAVIWLNVWNTFFQTCLCGFMWGMNRYDRPSWSTGLFVALACIVAGIGGVIMFQEGKKVKKVEGAPISREERQARGWPLEDEETGRTDVPTNGAPEVTEDNKSSLKDKVNRALG